MNNSRPSFVDDVPISTLIRREFFFMIISGLMISILIAWATVGVFETSFSVRFLYASVSIISLNIIAYIVKVSRRLK